MAMPSDFLPGNRVNHNEAMTILEDHKLQSHSSEHPGTLLVIAMAAFAACWAVMPAVYQLAVGRQLFATTQPATQPALGLQPHDLVALSILGPIAGLFTLIAGHLLWFRDPFKQIGLTIHSLRDGGWKQGLIAALMILPAMFLIVLLTEKVWNLLKYSHPMEHDLLRVMGGEPTHAVRIAIALSAIVLAPLFEELFFRGTIQRACQMIFSRLSFTPTDMPSRPWQRWLPIVITSLLFTAVHGALWLMPPIFFLSLCLGYAYQRTRNLWVPIIVHATFNAVSVTMFLFTR